jgi:8-oxo-dGTP pyrophosphatase MutT (NUDIX family)
MNKMLKKLFLPKFLGESLYIPFVGAIIEKEIEGKRYVLIQKRQKMTDPIYSGSVEIPGGKFRAYEDVYETLKREVKEETGLSVTVINGEERRLSVKNRGDESVLIEPFCVTQMKNGPFIGLIFLCQAEGKLLIKTNESSDIRWMEYTKLRDLVIKNQEKIYTVFLGPLKKYLGLMSFCLLLGTVI